MSVRLNRVAIQRIMGEKKLTGKAVADKMGISNSALSNALLRRTYSHINAVKLAKVLGVPYETILKKEDLE